ncbi:unnamed protein product [Caenorhabditis nigoni]
MVFENDFPSTVDDFERKLVTKDVELVKAKEEIETNFDYGNQIVELKLKSTRLEIVAEKYEDLKKEVEDGKKNQAQPVSKDQEKLVKQSRSISLMPLFSKELIEESSQERNSLMAKNEMLLAENNLKLDLACIDEEERMKHMEELDQDPNEDAPTTSNPRKRTYI